MTCTKRRYQFTRIKDLENFDLINEEVCMNLHALNRTVIPITKAQRLALEKQWMTVDTIKVNAALTNKN